MQVIGYQPFRAPEGHVGQGMLIFTTRGNIFTLFHPTTVLDSAVIWVCGANGGVSGPAEAIYTQMAEELAEQGIASLRVDYRLPSVFVECVLDTLAAVALLEGVGFQKVALVGHSFGGAVVIAAAPFAPMVKAVAALSSQDVGAERVADVSPRPLLLAHGDKDEVIPVQSSRGIFAEAKEPKELRVLEGAGHRLTERKQELHDLLAGFLKKNLGAGPGAPPPPPKPQLLRP
jgi:alpha/beta superfamily hydrolase